MSEQTWESVASGEISRDRFGRPLVIPPGGGEPVPYTRCTTFVGCLEDTYNLSLWQKRMVAVGLAARPDLLLRASSLGGPPDDELDEKRWKDEMNAVAEAATEAASASASATIGTALHRLTERLDRGQPLGVIPDAYQPHLAAYAEATADLRSVHIERFTVHDGLRIGGTPDRVVSVAGSDRLYIADVKTGTIEYGTGKMAMQLAVYARSALYGADGSRTWLGDVDIDRGLIIALSAKTGACRLLWIDLAAGWEAVQIAADVRAWRARRGLTKPYGESQVDIRALPRTAANALVAAIKVARTREQLVELWQAAGTAWTDEHTALANAQKAAIQLADHFN